MSRNIGLHAVINVGVLSLIQPFTGSIGAMDLLALGSYGAISYT